VWDGDSDADGDGFSWDDPFNWTADSGLPTAADDVLIDDPDVGAVTIVVDSAGLLAKQLSMPGIDNLSITAGDLTLNADSTIQGDLLFTSGTLNLNADLTVNGSVTWSGGATIQGSGAAFITNGTATVTDSELSGVTWENFGNASMPSFNGGDSLTLTGAAAVVTNHSGATFDFQNDSAVGTGINTHPEFGARVARALSEATGFHFEEAENHFEAQHAKDGVVHASGALRTIAVSLSKIAGDIRLMGCGPRCGIGELKLPAVQPGSSIMPGKVNPVICESVVMAACQVIGNDQAIALGGFGGVGSLLDLNVAMPMMADNLMDSITLLTGACRVLDEKLLQGLEADAERCAELIEGSLAMCTSLVPAIGYDKSAALAKRAFAEGKTVREVALEQGVLPEDELNRLLDPAKMTEPG